MYRTQKITCTLKLYYVQKIHVHTKIYMHVHVFAASTQNITDANTIVHVSDTCIHRQALPVGIILTLAAIEAGSFLKRSVPLTFGSDFKSKIPIFLVGVAPSPSSFAAVGGE